MIVAATMISGLTNPTVIGIKLEQASRLRTVRAIGTAAATAAATVAAMFNLTFPF
jgi:hypothetical protein